MAVTQTLLPEKAGSNYASLGANWRLQFLQPDGVPLTMSGLEAIDFGAISYKEIFQNVKTILATPLYSAMLERTLGLDNSIVDRPINDAAAATVAILDAVTSWEPRAQIMNLQFEADAINGHLVVILQLNILNVIYRSNTPYSTTSIFPAPLRVVQNLPPPPPLATGPVGPVGPAGATGQRGSLWFTSVGAPPAGPLTPMTAQPSSGQGPAGPAGPQGQRGFVWLQGAGAPVTPQNLDMYLDTSNGDVWQYDGAAGTWRRTGTKHEQP
jgi:phage baseplate assembly protein W